MPDASSHHFQSPSSSIGMKLSDSLTRVRNCTSLTGLLLFLGSVPWCGDDTLTPLPFITISVFLIDYCAFRQTRCYELIRDPCRARGLILFPPCTRSAVGRAGAWHHRCSRQRWILTLLVRGARLFALSTAPISVRHGPVSDGSSLSNNPGARVVWPGANIKPLWRPDVHIFSWLCL